MSLLLSGNLLAATAAAGGESSLTFVVGAADLNNFNTDPQTISLSANTLQDLTGDAYVAVQMGDGTGPLCASMTIGGNSATACDSGYGGENGTGGSATMAVSIHWFRASSPFTDDDVVVTPDTGNNSGDIQIAVFHAVNLTFQTGLGGGVVRDGGGSPTAQDITTTCAANDFLLVAYSTEGSITTLAFNSGATAASGYPVLNDRGFLVGSNTAASANQTIDATCPSGGDVAGKAIVLRPLA